VQKEVTELTPLWNWIYVCNNTFCRWIPYITYGYQTRAITELAERGHTFEYYIEHELLVADPHGMNSREWLKDGSDVSLSAKEVVPIKDKKDERDIFQYWSINGVPNEANSISLKMSKPYVVKAVYGREYRVKVSSEFGHPALDESEGWYGEGEEATVSVEQELPLEGLMGFLGGKRIFDGWYSDGGLESRMAKFTLVVDEPKSLRAEWRTDITMPIVILIVLIILAVLAFLLLYRMGYLKGLKRVSRMDELESEIGKLKAEIEELKEQLKKRKL
ncbi:MAG: hypothetical protein QW265_02505, partial [Candidatus Bathyarchaeia archaeon]